MRGFLVYMFRLSVGAFTEDQIWKYNKKYTTQTSPDVIDDSVVRHRAEGLCMLSS